MQIAFVISSTGEIKVYSKSAGINMVTIKELRESTTIHVYVVSAGSERNVAISFAFLLVFSTIDNERFAYVLRLPYAKMCCIPSYTVDELLRYCAHFNVP